MKWIKVVLVLGFFFLVPINGDTYHYRVIRKICPSGTYHDPFTDRCRRVPGGGSLIKFNLDAKCSRGFQGLLAHSRRSRFYFVCQKNAVLTCICDEKEYFSRIRLRCEKKKNSYKLKQDKTSDDVVENILEKYKCVHDKSDDSILGGQNFQKQMTETLTTFPATWHYYQPNIFHPVTAQQSVEAETYNPISHFERLLNGLRNFQSMLKSAERVASSSQEILSQEKLSQEIFTSEISTNLNHESVRNEKSSAEFTVTLAPNRPMKVDFDWPSFEVFPKQTEKPAEEKFAKPGEEKLEEEPSDLVLDLNVVRNSNDDTESASTVREEPQLMLPVDRVLDQFVQRKTSNVTGQLQKVKLSIKDLRKKFPNRFTGNKTFDYDFDDDEAKADYRKKFIEYYDVFQYYYEDAPNETLFQNEGSTTEILESTTIEDDLETTTKNDLHNKSDEPTRGDQKAEDLMRSEKDDSTLKEDVLAQTTSEAFDVKTTTETESTFSFPKAENLVTLRMSSDTSITEPVVFTDVTDVMTSTTEQTTEKTTISPTEQTIFISTTFQPEETSLMNEVTEIPSDQTKNISTTMYDLTTQDSFSLISIRSDKSGETSHESSDKTFDQFETSTIESNSVKSTNQETSTLVTTLHDVEKTSISTDKTSTEFITESTIISTTELGSTNFNTKLNTVVDDTTEILTNGLNKETSTTEQTTVAENETENLTVSEVSTESSTFTASSTLEFTELSTTEETTEIDALLRRRTAFKSSAFDTATEETSTISQHDLEDSSQQSTITDETTSEYFETSEIATSESFSASTTKFEVESSTITETSTMTTESLTDFTTITDSSTSLDFSVESRMFGEEIAFSSSTTDHVSTTDLLELSSTTLINENTESTSWNFDEKESSSLTDSTTVLDSTILSETSTEISSSEPSTTHERDTTQTTENTEMTSLFSTDLEATTEVLTTSTDSSKVYDSTLSTTIESLSEFTTNFDLTTEVTTISTELSTREQIESTKLPNENIISTTSELTTLEPTTLQLTTLEPTTLEPTTLQPTTLEPTTLEPFVEQVAAVLPRSMDPSDQLYVQPHKEIEYYYEYEEYEVDDKGQRIEDANITNVNGNENDKPSHKQRRDNSFEYYVESISASREFREKSVHA